MPNALEPTLTSKQITLSVLPNNTISKPIDRYVDPDLANTSITDNLGIGLKHRSILRTTSNTNFTLSLSIFGTDYSTL